MKRAFDLVLTIVLAPLWLPLLLAVALAVRCAMGRPVFFRQRRAGFREREFSIVKFRTMREGHGSDADRLTRFGAFLRASSLDELPELFNVLRGEMSLVGPRPLPVEYLPRYTREERRRHDVMPGITGWAQVNGRNLLDWETKFRYDLEYVRRRSFLFDLKILALTVLPVLGRRGIAHRGEATMGELPVNRGA